MARATWDLEREPYWRKVFSRWRRSGLSVREFCQAEGVNEPRFYWWRRKLETAEAPKPAFLPVHVIANDAEPVVSQSIEVVLHNGRCLRVPPGFDAETLVKLVELLDREASSC